jgi:lysozyme
MIIREGLELVKTFEGFHRVVKEGHPVQARPYNCPAGFWTIGYGHLCRQDHPPITMEQGDAYLIQDISAAEFAVRKLIQQLLGPYQQAALVSFVFNLGIGRLRGSTLRAKVNRGELDAVPAELRKWVYGAGQRLPGLVLRREAEAALWLKG